MTDMVGGVLFTFFLIAIHSLLNLLSSPFSRRSVAAIKMLTSCVARICLRGNLAGPLLTDEIGKGRTTISGRQGAAVAAPGPAARRESWVVA